MEADPMKERTLKALALLAILGGSAALLAACNTVKGVGKDITYAGEKREEAIAGRDGTQPKK